MKTLLRRLFNFLYVTYSTLKSKFCSYFTNWGAETELTNLRRFIYNFNELLGSGSYLVADVWANMWAIFARWFLPAYYVFLAVFVLCYKNWLFYLICVLIIEVLILLLGCFCNWIWPFRLVIVFFLQGIWTIHDRSAYTGPEADAAAIRFLGDFTIFPKSTWAALFDNASSIWNICCYQILYFKAMYLPYMCMGVILFAPLVSFLFLFLFGYLIGYVLAGRLASGFIFAGAISSYYIWFKYENYRSEILDRYGSQLETVAVQFNYVDGKQELSLFPLTQLEQRIITPTSEPAFVCAQQAKCFNLRLDFGSFINSPFFGANFEFILDSVSIVMVVTITTISFLVHIFSTVYMSGDPHQVRFYGLLSLFTFFMIVLVMASNLVMLYIGWEGVGLTSFLLIAFWFTRVPALKAAVKAMLINKIGDMFLLLAISHMVYFSLGSSDIAAISSLVPGPASEVPFGFGLTGADVIAISLAIAACVKSAQVFFHTWLADAMEGPTPVSALLHAATMVTAGVYLVIRFSYLFEASFVARCLLFVVSICTVILSSAIALAQYDIKKIIAFSTCSQLGLMFLACSMSAYDFALYHFFNHAFFKCLLFLAAGAIIHELRNEQDIRRMGGLAKRMPFTFVCFSIASLSLVGMPGFSGATSKDAILHLVNYTALRSDSWFSSLTYFSLNILIYFTMAYTARLAYYVFLGPANFNRRLFKANYRDVLAREPTYAFVFIFLAFMSVFGGSIFKSYFISDGTNDSFIDVHNDILIGNFLHHSLASDQMTPYVATFLTLHALGAAAYFIYKFNRRPFSTPSIYTRPARYALFCFFNRRCYFDDVYNAFLIRPLIQLSITFNTAVENGIFMNGIHLLWVLIKLPMRLIPDNRKNFSLAEHFIHTLTGIAISLILLNCFNQC